MLTPANQPHRRDLPPAPVGPAPAGYLRRAGTVLRPCAVRQAVLSPSLLSRPRGLTLPRVQRRGARASTRRSTGSRRTAPGQRGAAARASRRTTPCSGRLHVPAQRREIRRAPRATSPPRSLGRRRPHEHRRRRVAHRHPARRTAHTDPLQILRRRDHVGQRPRQPGHGHEPDGYGGENSRSRSPSARTSVRGRRRGARRGADQPASFDWRERRPLLRVRRPLQQRRHVQRRAQSPASRRPPTTRAATTRRSSRRSRPGYFDDLGVNALWLTVPMDNTNVTGAGSDGHTVQRVPRLLAAEPRQGRGALRRPRAPQEGRRRRPQARHQGPLRLRPARRAAGRGRQRRRDGRHRPRADGGGRGRSEAGLGPLGGEGPARERPRAGRDRPHRRNHEHLRQARRTRGAGRPRQPDLGLRRQAAQLGRLGHRGQLRRRRARRSPPPTIEVVERGPHRAAIRVDAQLPRQRASCRPTGSGRTRPGSTSRPRSTGTSGASC